MFVKKLFNSLKGDRVIWVITLVLLAFSLVSVYSFVPILVKIEGGSPSKYLLKHFVYVILGLVAMIWIHRKNPAYFSKLARFGFYLAIGLLIFTLFFGQKVNDAGRWVRIPFVGLTFQSSDFAKLALIIYLSRLLDKKKELLDSWKEGFWPIMIPIIIICGLIVKDNFSTAAILFFISLIILFLGRVPISKLLLFVGGGILLFAAIVVLHKAAPNLNILPRYETWENRLINRFEDNGAVLDNAQAMNAKLGIYNGGLFGQGVGDGKVKEYIPEAYADFFFASFVEEFGMFGAILLVFAYLILLYRMIRIALKSQKLFETLTVLGIGILILIQASVNMMVCTGIFPVTGQNMPLLAMGGSALIMTCLSIGIVQSIAYSQQPKEKNIDEENEIVES
jgi:cell division protein FtsW